MGKSIGSQNDIATLLFMHFYDQFTQRVSDVSRHPGGPRGPAQLIDAVSCAERDQVHGAQCLLLTRPEFMTEGS